jgi:hypothetical protein
MAKTITLAQLRRDAKRHPHARTQRVWEQIIQYANADWSDRADMGLAELKPAYRKWILNLKFLMRLYPSFPGDDGPPTVKEITRYSRPKRRLDPLSHFAIRYHDRFTDLLTWLCAPDKSPQLRSAAVDFLQANARGVRWQIEHVPESNFDEHSHGYLPVFYRRQVEYDSIMSPLCKFIFDQVDRYHVGELELSDAVPIRICKRDGCSKFVLPERKGRKEYCSNICRAKDYQHNRTDWNDYMRRYRSGEAGGSRDGMEQSSRGTAKSKSKENLR